MKLDVRCDVLLGLAPSEAHVASASLKWVELHRRAVPTAITGIYGMNFEHMPELKWTYGYFLVIAVIAAICSTLYWRFRRNGWI